jgi:hypothetical protein
MAEKSFTWTEHAVATFADLDPSTDEIDEVDKCMKEVLAGGRECSQVLPDRDLPKKFLFKSGRFGVLFWYQSDDAEIADVILWP